MNNIVQRIAPINTINEEKYNSNVKYITLRMYIPDPVIPEVCKFMKPFFCLNP